MTEQLVQLQRWFRHCLLKKRVSIYLAKCVELSRRIKLIQRWWRDCRSRSVAKKWIAGLKVRWIMKSQDFKRRRSRVKDVEDEIIESIDPSWTALMFKELVKAKEACCHMVNTGVTRHDWVSYGRKAQYGLKTAPRIVSTRE